MFGLKYLSKRDLLLEILKNQEKMMSALSDAVAALTANLAKLQTDMNKAFTDLEAAVAAAGGDSADVAAAVAAIGTVNASLQSMDTAALAADATTQPAPDPSA